MNSGKCKISQLKAGVILSYATTTVNVLIQLLYTPVMLRLLGQSEYGLYTLASSIVSYLSLCGMGITSAYIRFYSKYIQKENKELIERINGAFLLLGVLSSFISVMAGSVLMKYSDWVFGTQLTVEELGKGKCLLAILIFNMALTFPTGIFEAILIAQEQFIVQRGMKLLTTIASPFIALPLLLIGYDSVALVIITTILTCCGLGVNLYYVKAVLKTKFRFGKWPQKLFGEIGTFSIFIFLNMIIDQINWNVDKLILGRYHGTIAVAVYGIGAQLNGLFTQCSTAISSVFVSKVNRYIAESANGEMGQVNKLFQKVGRIQFLILAPILGAIILYGRYFISYWAGQGYEEAYNVALLLMIPALIPLIQNLGIEIQRAQNKHHIRSWIYLITTILNVVISISLCKSYGVSGVAVGTTISLIFGNGITMNFCYQRYMKVNVVAFWKEIIKLLPIMLLPVIVGMVMLSRHPITSFAVLLIEGTIYVSVYLVSVWTMVIRKGVLWG